MRVYSMIRPRQLQDFPAQAQRAESLGFDGITLLELTVPPTLSAVACAMSTTNLDILTGVFVAFPRSPMATAYDAWSIQFHACANTLNRCAQFGIAGKTDRDCSTPASIINSP
jgi:hypothetical protein